MISYRAALNEPMMTPEEEVDVLARWQTRREPAALERIVRSHARLAYSIAARYTSNEEHLKDLAQEGMIGIMKAADKFDQTCGTRFATYSRWWIMTFISAAAAKVSTVIDMPSRTFLDAKMGRLDEADQALAWSAAFASVALDAPVGEDGGTSAMDMLECPRPDPEDVAVKQSMEGFFRKAVRDAMKALTPRERHVVERRRLSDRPETLEQIAADLRITRERVRQIEVIALGKIRRYLANSGFPVTALRS